MFTADEGEETRKSKGVLGLVRIPSVILMCVVICTCAVMWSFLDPTLEPHLKKAHLMRFIKPISSSHTHHIFAF